MFPRVTHPSAALHISEDMLLARLACVRPAASVRSEPGSNSQVDPLLPSIQQMPYGKAKTSKITKFALKNITKPLIITNLNQ